MFGRGREGATAGFGRLGREGLVVQCRRLAPRVDGRASSGHGGAAGGSEGERRDGLGYLVEARRIGPRGACIGAQSDRDVCSRCKLRGLAEDEKLAVTRVRGAS